MACSMCGDHDLITDLVDDELVLVCSSCGQVATGDNEGENESKLTGTLGENNQFDKFSNGDDSAEDYNTDGPECREAASAVDGELCLDSVGMSPEKSSLNKLSEDSSWATSPTGNPDIKAGTLSPTQKCSQCGGNNFTSDYINETEQLVCVDCGFFSEEQALVSSNAFTVIAGSSEAYKWSRAPKPKFAPSGSYVNKRKQSDIKRIEIITAKLGWQSHLTDKAVTLYEEIYPHKLVKYTSGDLKDALCISCVYSVARENEVKLTLKTLMNIQNVRKKLITKALNLMKSIRQKPLAHQTVSSLPEHILASGKFSTELLKKISKLVDMCEKGFVTQGRDHANVVISVAHLVWISEDIASRQSVTLKKFCAQYSFRESRHCASVQNDVKELLVTLASQLPWIQTPVTRNNFIHYLDKIVTFSNSVFSKAKKGDPGVVSKLSDTSETELNCKRKNSPILPPLAPPSMKKRRRRSSKDTSVNHCLPSSFSAADLDKEDLSESEFSEQEISSYLLTAHETQLKQVMMQL